MRRFLTFPFRILGCLLIVLFIPTILLITWIIAGGYGIEQLRVGVIKILQDSDSDE